MRHAESVQHTSEVLTVEQFAELMQVSRTTVFGWIKTGVLQEGVHYLRLGRILRFCWREGLFFNRQQKSVPQEEGPLPPLEAPRSELDSQRGEAPVNRRVLTFDRGKAPGVNLDY